MNKKLILAAIACLALAGCSNEEYLGDPGGLTGERAISFDMSTPAMTRATGEAAAQELDYSFQVYATKTVGSTTSNVFATNAYNATSNTPYWVWYTATTDNTTASNTMNWDYVGAAGTHGTAGHEATIESDKDQTIKYWDYSADQYDFVALKAKAPTSGTAATITHLTTTGFNVTATAEQLGNLYIADKVTITTKNNTPSFPASNNPTTFNQVGNVVQFTFRNAAAKVRIGFYETIPGWVVNNVKFYYNNVTTPVANVTLDGKFIGNNENKGTYTVTFGSPSTFTRDNNASFQTYHDFGALTYGATAEALGNGIAITSASPTWAGNNATANYYSYMLPNPNANDVANMVLCVDYDLYNSKSQETIHVRGAKAVVPTAYMSWKSNYAYTYLFKISDNTNGTTSATGTDPVGLYPITFNAVTVATTDGSQGTITTVTTPAITTYQAGSVSNAGITYANANGPIYITVNTDGTLADLSVDNTKLYTVADGTTEAELLLTTKEKTASTLLSIASADATSQGITFTSGKHATFTPAASTTYALEYATITAVTGLTANTSSVTGYYTRTGEAAPYTYTKITEATTAAENTTYYNVVYQYKIIIVG